MSTRISLKMYLTPGQKARLCQGTFEKPDFVGGRVYLKTCSKERFFVKVVLEVTERKLALWGDIGGLGRPL